MAKTRIERKRVTGRKTASAVRKSTQGRAMQGVAKPTRPRGRSARLQASKGAVNKPKNDRDRPRKLRIGEEVEVLAKERKKATSKTKKTSNKQENELMASTKRTQQLD